MYHICHILTLVSGLIMVESINTRKPMTSDTFQYCVFTIIFSDKHLILVDFFMNCLNLIGQSFFLKCLCKINIEKTVLKFIWRQNNSHGLSRVNGQNEIESFRVDLAIIIVDAEELKGRD